MSPDWFIQSNMAALLTRGMQTNKTNDSHDIKTLSYFANVDQVFERNGGNPIDFQIWKPQVLQFQSYDSFSNYTSMVDSSHVEMQQFRFQYQSIFERD